MVGDFIFEVRWHLLTEARYHGGFQNMQNSRELGYEPVFKDYYMQGSAVFVGRLFNRKWIGALTWGKRREVGGQKRAERDYDSSCLAAVLAVWVMTNLAWLYVIIV